MGALGLKIGEGHETVFAAVIFLILAMPSFAEIIEFKPADNWVSKPNDGSGGPLVLMWAQPKGLSQSGTQFFSPVQVSTSVFPVPISDIPDIQVVPEHVVPEPELPTWIFLGMAVLAIARYTKRRQS